MLCCCRMAIFTKHNVCVKLNAFETEMKNPQKQAQELATLNKMRAELRDETVHYTEEELVLYNRLCCHIFCLKDGLGSYQGRKEIYQCGPWRHDKRGGRGRNYIIKKSLDELYERHLQLEKALAQLYPLQKSVQITQPLNTNIIAPLSMKQSGNWHFKE